VADIHCKSGPSAAIQRMLTAANESADILLLGGDLTDRGLPEEAQVLAKDLRATVKIPVVAVFGNHDVESGQEAEVQRILCDAGVSLLDGEAVEINGVGFAGIKGFIGGFGPRTLQAWGERTIKRVVHESVEESLKLEGALAKLRTRSRVVLMHYAPIAATLQGEPPEIYAFLGSSRLEEPISRFPVDVVFHGHAHAGSPEGKAAGDVPVYNVAMPLLARYYPDRPYFRLFEVAVDPEPSAHSPDLDAESPTYSVMADVSH